MGPKLAQRIVLELKDRVKKMGFTGGTLELTGTDDAGIVSASPERRAGRTGAYCARLYTVRSRAGRGEAVLSGRKNLFAAL